MKSRNHGFTLIEMMITVAILAIILAIAAPSFSRMLENSRVTTQTNDFVAAVNVARTEAVRTGSTVWLTAKGAGLQDGWCVRASADACGTANPPDLVDHAALDANLSVSYQTDKPETTSFAFTRLGTLANAGTATAIELAPKSCASGQRKRRIDVNAIGRISIESLDC